MTKFEARDDYVAAIRDAIVQNNPNQTDDPDFQEVWDEEAIKDLANYAQANGMIEGPYEEDVVVMDKLLDPSHEDCLVYFLYDLMKWTRANNS